MTTLTMTSGFGRLWSAAFLSNVSDGIRAAAFPLLAAGLTRDPVLVAGVTIAQQVPWLVSGPLSGVVADRVDRRSLVWGVNVVRAAVFAMMAVLILSGDSALWMVYLAAVVLGVGESFYDNATQTMVPALVPSDQLERANGRLVAAEVVGNEFIGPPLGAALFGIAAYLPFVGNAGVLVLAVVLVLGVVGTFHAPSEQGVVRRGIWADLVEGFGFVTHHREIATITVLVGVLAAADAAWFAILVLYSLEVLALPAVGFGALLAVGASGGVAGAVGAERLTQRLSLRTILTGTLVLSALTQLGLGLTSSSVVGFVLIAVSSLAFGVWNVVTMSLRQRLAPSAFLGRVNSIYRTVGMAAASLGALIGGVTAGVWGLRAPFLIGVPFLLVGAVFAAGTSKQRKQTLL